MNAFLIAESSAGMTAVEIYNNDETELVWSTMFFKHWATDRGYIDGLFDAYQCLRNAADVAGYEGGDVDEDGCPVKYDNDDTYTAWTLSYDTESGKWTVYDDFRKYGQGREIIDAMMLAGIIPADEEHEDHATEPVVVELARRMAVTPDQIRAARKAAGLTQEQAGALVGAPSRRTWQNWETGRRNMPGAKWELFQIKTRGGRNEKYDRS